MRFKDRDIINKCGLDAYFFLRYLQTLLVIFVPLACVIIPILIPINYIGGIGQNISASANQSNQTDASNPSNLTVTGLDVLAWGNVAPTKTHRRWAHLILAWVVIIWVCFVFFTELRVYIKVRQDYLTSAEHRLRASATTVLVSSIPEKWLTEEALRGLFDVFPGGIKNIWLTRDFTKLLDKINKRDTMHSQLESAESDLIRAAKKAQLKQQKKDQKKRNKHHDAGAETKEERVRRQAEEDNAAKRRAEAGEGVSAGKHGDRGDHGDHRDAAMESVNKGEEAPKHDEDDPPRKRDRDGWRSDEDALREEEKQSDRDEARERVRQEQEGGFFSTIGGGLARIGDGFKGGVNAVGKAGDDLVGGARAIGENVDGELGRTGGFEVMKPATNVSDAKPPTRGSDRPRRVQILDDDEKGRTSMADSDSPRSRHAHSASAVAQQKSPKTSTDVHNGFGNTTRKLTDINEMYINEENKWYEFWKPPPGGYASPIPQGGNEGDEFPFKKDKEDKSAWKVIKSYIPFMGDDDDTEVDYPPAINPNYEENKDRAAAWERWVDRKDRPHHRLPWFDWTPTWFPGFPFLHKKVDTIYYCRGELARLNMEIEEDQQHPERYPIMNSAFIQFNHQVAAHMACQSVAHHVPKQMAPRIVEVAPKDVIWDNMAIKWWDEWLRTALVWAIVAGMVILWAFPVAWTASLSQIDTLIKNNPWLGFLKANSTVYSVTKAVAGVLPALVLAIILWLVPIILGLFAQFQGAKTGSQKTERVQVYYFIFLFVQVFLIVAIASSLVQVVQDIASNPVDIPNTLASNLPKSSNYFFTYMILQALSTSSGTLLQVGGLIGWYVLARILDNTARSKWTRNVKLSDVTWGSFFPVYTNFACIALIYSVISPLIFLFAIITFSLLWVANRYAMLYVYRFESDTGGVLFPRAINQTFTGLYVMELCLTGLFFLQQDQNGTNTCIPQGIIMIVSIFLTVIYQFLLNWSFGPLFRYLPITFEDEAVLRDIAFQKAQDKRMGIEDSDDDEATNLTAGSSATKQGNEDIELQKLHSEQSHGHKRAFSAKLGKLNPVKALTHASTWSARQGKQTLANGRHAFLPEAAERNLRNANEYRRARRERDLEAQRAMGEALYGGFNDEIEDLTPQERDQLVRKAFQHYAMRARRPTVWIPRDDLGVSDDEIQRTKEFSDHIWISNEGTALDSKVRVVYGRAPPDFDDLDIINL
jgi:calcium permeable stress-gated cation channel